ncbi:CvpA family protein [Thalassoroseus pseudoceratinae]|uniref:CvpA family protein n=1 Tax=Thalassoroseus pseudoceratinae TaxID=2713176 RepID=UPI001423AC15|nr:CvpA family protein [Thalassoroseus pseudoceratinae]
MWYDLLIACILIYATLRGAQKGITWQLAVIGSVLMCFAFAGSLSEKMAPFFTVEPPLNKWLAMLVLYVIFSIISFAIARQLRSLIEKMKFQELDSHLGAVLGLAKGGLIAFILTFFAITLTQKFPRLRDEVFYSYTGHYAAVVADRLHTVMPEELYGIVHPHLDQLDRTGIDLHAHSDDDVTDSDDNHPHPDHPDHDRRDQPPAPIRIIPPNDPLAENNGWESDGNKPFPLNPPARDKNSDSDLVARREWEKLLREIGSVYSDDPSAQNAITDEVSDALGGLPDRVKLAVIKDWYTDLLVFDRSSDPDKQTDLSSPLDERIVRQLERIGVPLSTLSADLQTRLRGQLRR